MLAARGKINLPKCDTKSGRSLQKHVPDMADGAGGIEPLGAHRDAVLDTVTTEHAERVIQVCQPLFGGGVAAVREEAIGL